MSKKVIEVGFPIGHEVLKLGIEQSHITEAEYYKQAIMENISSVNRLDVLIYLNRLIDRIVKEGR